MSAALALDGLSRRFGAVVAADDVSFAVQPGEVFGFCGRNGAGKTTTMRMALGLLAPDRGTSMVLGQPLATDIVRRVGYMPAERGVYARMLVRDQLRYFAELHGARRRRADEQVVRWAHRLDITHHLDQTVDTLSTGNKQRVQLATALVHDPELLVLDEPFAGLDPVATEVMSDVLRDVAADGAGVLFSSHQLDLVERIAHRVGVIEVGRMVAVGSLDELRADGVVQVSVAFASAAEARHGATQVAASMREAAVELDGRLIEVKVDTLDDPTSLLDLARSGGRVVEFRLLQRSLAELYIDLVGRPANGFEAAEERTS